MQLTPIQMLQLTHALTLVTRRLIINPSSANMEPTCSNSSYKMLGTAQPLGEQYESVPITIDHMVNG